MKKFLMLLALMVAVSGCELLNTDQDGYIGSYGNVPESASSASFSTVASTGVTVGTMIYADLVELEITGNASSWTSLTGKMTPASRISFIKGKYHKIHGAKKVKAGSYHGVRVTLPSFRWEDLWDGSAYWDGVPTQYYTMVNGVLKELEPVDGVMEFTTANGGLSSPIEVATGSEVSIVLECYHQTRNDDHGGLLVLVRWTEIIDGEVID